MLGHCTHMGVRCAVTLQPYENGRPALVLDIDDPSNEDDKARWCTATTNLPEVDLADDVVAIKDCDELQGMMQSLVDAGIVEDTGATIPTGWSSRKLARLIKLPELN